MTPEEEVLITAQQVIETFSLELQDQFGCWNSSSGAHSWRDLPSDAGLMRMCPDCQKVQMVKRKH
jgi:hypothetical protein